MTIHDLWNEYRKQCCDPLDETSREIETQRLIFMAGIASAIGHVIENPHGFHELLRSISDWMDSIMTEQN